MAVIDISRQISSLLSDLKLISSVPSDLLHIIQYPKSDRILDAIAEAALIPRLTDQIYAHFEDVFPDICCRWLLGPADQTRQARIIAAFSRILPFSPYLVTLVEQCLERPGNALPSHGLAKLGLASLKLENSDHLSESTRLIHDLLTVWRLIHFDIEVFGHLISPQSAQRLFSHERGAVRHLAIRVFCQILQASDLMFDALVNAHTPNHDLSGDYDGLEIDYEFLSLYERARIDAMEPLRVSLAHVSTTTDAAAPQRLCPLVSRYGNAILPRLADMAVSKSGLVLTESTQKNLEEMAKMLRKFEPILISGPPGSGKTALVDELAKGVGSDSSMVTLHLNEQTDAKMLIGLYTSGSTPGSFLWRPGILTTAVREGRWVLIEDLDRAPNEVVSTLLPLVENRKLLIPSRGETIKAPSGFRLFATVRSARGMHGQETLPNMLGRRFWQHLSIRPLPEVEIEQIIIGLFPLLHRYIPSIVSVQRRLSLPTSITGLQSSRYSTGRQVNLRDMLKWCRRLCELLMSAGCKTGDEPINETTRERMFMEAVDCFAGYIPESPSRQRLVHQLAEELAIAKEKVEHYLLGYSPTFEERMTGVRAGRVSLWKKQSSKGVSKRRRPFAATNHARKLLEQIAVSVKLNEPVLLVGETGIGKTTVIQQLAESLGNRLVVVNLSQQIESGDLVGGFKPVNVRSLAVPLEEEFEDLFSATGISALRNDRYLKLIRKCFGDGRWSRVSSLWREAPRMFAKILGELGSAEAAKEKGDDTHFLKRRRTESRLQTLVGLKPRWDRFSQLLDQFDIQVSGDSSSVAFSFVEGNIIKAARNGDWVLLDEINLASSDTLEAISDLLVGPGESPSILLSETGEIDRIKAHPDFRVFAAMNPATDVGKRDLPIGIRSRFTEIYVSSPDRDLKDLLTVIKTYLSTGSDKEDQAVDDIARLYLNTKRLAEEKRLVDGANEVPHFSLRTLTRVLIYVNHVSPLYGLRRALFEGFSMGFLTLLSGESEEMLMPLIHHHLLDPYGGPTLLLSHPPRRPSDVKEYVLFSNQKRDRQYWLPRGGQQPIQRPDYIITPYVERNLLNLVRATSTRRFTILLQGPTSAGKTSMIEYLANFSGNKLVRINNHEHTDLQEYLGTYVSGSDGKLRFQEGLLVEAIRKGYWIVLDELNLAPTDVLEALNRLLDDNRELLIPETQEVVRPHENFLLFGTQNPPSLYGGRKILSRAFRNRFLELHFDDIPQNELETILQQRSRNTAPSDCRRIVSVYKELTRLRQTSRLFEQKNSFATLRDLFRWAQRDADNREQIAANGFMLLAERVRDSDERLAVKSVIETVFKVTIDPELVYGWACLPDFDFFRGSNRQGVVWTQAMRRLFVLVSAAIRNNEPVLLVGETGCGKTTVCQLLAEQLAKKLHIVNAHQNTETGDLIGSQRPVRNRAAVVKTLGSELRSVLVALGQDGKGELDELARRYRSLSTSLTQNIPQSCVDKINALEIKANALFEWSDGSLVEAMKTGQLFLLDEISLAEDSVLERLNSMLEPGRTLLLAEKVSNDDALVTASEGFQFFATMNPGGDYGKKELSPALRNRFTEIWVPPLTDLKDVDEIFRNKLRENLGAFADGMIRFAVWFGETFRPNSSTALSIRELLVWVDFVNMCPPGQELHAIVHGAATVFIDALGANPSALLVSNSDGLHQQRQACLHKLTELLGSDTSAVYYAQPQITISNTQLEIAGFSLPRQAHCSQKIDFALHAPTTRLNAMRVMRALQMNKPILLEGSPGVGKTTLVTALSRLCGKPLARVNLSDQTDLMDLFGSDMPVDGAEAGVFAWREAPFLRAMQNGEWVLLDEMNLASQSVLEGLNACLDHRGEVYVAELDQVFKRHPDFRLFAAQNPLDQGGGRKGLPSSFVNRFIVVYADVLSGEDLALIAGHGFPEVPVETTSKLIQFVTQLERQVVGSRLFGAQGAPWEFNLRDILRWLQLLSSKDPLIASGDVSDFLDLVVRLRFRTEADRREVTKLFSAVFGAAPETRALYHDVNSHFFQVGRALLRRDFNPQPSTAPKLDPRPRLVELEALMISIQQNMPCVLSGPAGAGKSVLLQYVASLAGKSLVVFPLNADIDAMDLVGGFEQADPQREVNAALQALEEELQVSILYFVPQDAPVAALRLLHLLKLRSRDTADKIDLLSTARQLLCEVSPETPIAKALSEAISRLQEPEKIPSPRFEWLDGVIVRAMQNGQWLVLDNANLCSASVLDRLNSLLEPNGHLSINEHCDPGGEPRVIRPHCDFRVFLTVDPRHGELSRAMRNRAVEIHLDILPSQINPPLAFTARIEGHLHRYHLAGTIACEDHNSIDQATMGLAPLALEVLSGADLKLLSRYVQAMGLGDVVVRGEWRGRYEKSAQRLLEYSTSPLATSVRATMDQMHADASETDSMSLSTAQPIHPLNNGPIVRVLQDKGKADVPYWLATVYECYGKIWNLAASIRLQEKSALPGNYQSLNHLNRLQRSFLAVKVSAVAGDSTARMSFFLLDSLDDIASLLLARLPCPERWMACRRILRRLMLYLERTFRIGTQLPFDEATFLAHCAQGSKLFGKAWLGDLHVEDRAFIGIFIDRLTRDFGAGFGLTTGLGMECLWKRFRPVPISTAEALRQSEEIEKVALRLDALRWKVDAAALGFIPLQAALCKIYSMARNDNRDASSLIGEMGTEVQHLELRAAQTLTAPEPYLHAQFEVLRKVMLLQTIKLKTEFLEERELLALSKLPTLEQMRLEGATGSAARLLQTLDSLLYQGPWSNGDQVAVPLLSKLAAVEAVEICSLSLLEKEIPLIGRYVASNSAAITEDPIQRLSLLLRKILLEILGAQDQNLRSLAETAFHDTLDRPKQYSSTTSGCKWPKSDEFLHICESMEPEQVARTVTQHFSPAIASLLGSASEKDASKAKAHSALAWTHAGIGAIKLFTPDKPFDPQLPRLLDIQLDAELQSALQSSISRLSRFESKFTGQTCNLRTMVLEQEVASLGPPLESVRVAYRPQESQLWQLQSIFRNGLKVASDPAVCLLVAKAGTVQSQAVKEDLEAVLGNVRSLIERLGLGFGAYQDMTRPLTGFLRCLELGLSLGLECCASSADAVVTPKSSELLKVTPFMGGRLWDFDAESLPTSSHDFFCFLHLAMSVEGGLGSISSGCRLSILRAIHTFYIWWSKKTEANRRAEESRQSLYRFRGSLEDEEELDEDEFRGLFPAYDNEEDENAPERASCKPGEKSNDTSLPSIGVADAHRQLFLTPKSPQECLQELMERACRGTGAAADSLILPGAVFALWQRSEEIFATDTAGASYNFYQDPNFPETRRLATLLGKTSTRIRELQSVDEISHMQPLADVQVACDKINQLPHGAPLAQLLARVEGLHAAVYEWQFGGWARSTHSILELHESITATIIRWRRLELSTWARLFDHEAEKCENEAKAWWFVAYEIVVAAPLSMVGSQPRVAEYASELVRDLEPYFYGAVIGQFSARLTLLRQLQKHLAFLADEYPSLSVVSDAVLNFIVCYGRYERPVREAVRKGRLPIEKRMKDVLLLASWKDTNISALRESARKSHLKLFRLVRKFRAVLGQDAKPVLDQGAPEEEACRNLPESCSVAVSNNRNASNELTATATGTATGIAVLLSSAMPGWLESHRRLLNVTRTVAIMQQASRTPEAGAATGGAALDAFVSGLKEEMAELKKETPSVLTEENEAAVRHLKARKRKLFADTLREMSKMGFKHRLSPAKLAQQESLQVVFCNCPPLVASSEARTGGFGGLAPHGAGDAHSSAARCAMPSEENMAMTGRAAPTTTADDEFYKAMELSVQSRAVARTHSDDLTAAEVGRSVGYLEAILHCCLLQRRTISTANSALIRLNVLIGQLDSIEHGFSVDSSSNSDWMRVLRWLVCVVEFGTRLVEIHGRMGDSDNGEATACLRQWTEELATTRKALDGLRAPPSGLTTPACAELEAKFTAQVVAFTADVKGLIEQRPGLGFILGQMLPWATVTARDLDVARPLDGRLEDFAAFVSDLCDRALVGFERLSTASAKLRTHGSAAESTDWVTSYDEAIKCMVQALRIDVIESDLRNCTDYLRRFGPESRGPASVLALLALPILQQYSATFRQRLGLAVDFHRATARAACELNKSFIKIATDGFCTPGEKSDETAGKEGKAEAGTGLGDGEGENDISKEIQPDEDLSELAQEAGHDGPRDDMEDAKDAIDMAGDDMEGETGSVRGSEDEEDGNDPHDKGTESGDDDDNDDMDEEAGAVDDLDPTAVDEKMWDGDGEKAEKEQRGRREMGTKDDSDDQVAAAEDAGAAKAKPGGEEEDGKDGSEENDDGGEGEEKEEKEEEDQNVEQPEDIKVQDEANLQDQHVAENGALALPEDMDLDLDGGKSQSDGESDHFDELSDMEAERTEGDEEEDAAAVNSEAEGDDGKTGDMDVEKDVDKDVDKDADKDVDEELDKNPDDAEPATTQDEADGGPDESAEHAVREEENTAEEPRRRPEDDAKVDAHQAAPSDVKGGGQQQDQSTDDAMDVDGEFQASSTNDRQGNRAETAADAETQPHGHGAEAQTRRGLGQAEDAQPRQRQDGSDGRTEQDDPFRRLGDALERWHRQQNEIMEANADDEMQQQQQQQGDGQGTNQEDGVTDREFRHVQDEAAPVDAQALGAAQQDEVRPLNEAMAIEKDATGDVESRVVPDQEEEEVEAAEAKATDDDRVGQQEQQDDDDDERNEGNGREEDTGAGVETRRGAFDQESSPAASVDIEMADGKLHDDDDDDDGDGGDNDGPDAEATEDRPRRDYKDYGEALRQWQHFQTRTQGLSASLASQLRLILTPSQATKLSGSFRTGKRLSIKRIIPYIASGYRRDKIWMRRSVPTKRTYQILLCVDDSKSMGEGGPREGRGEGESGRPGGMALESLVMVSRALAMVEAGQMGVVGFGADVFTAHELAEPFGSSHEAGARVLRQFGFQQDGTDMKRLVRAVLDRFRSAREAGGGGRTAREDGGDVWQLALILSDGLTPSSAHDGIRRLLREAVEERVMIVFIVMDDAASTSTSASSGKTGGGGEGRDSVLELREARFVPDGRGGSDVVIERYLDSFPFQYYLIVHGLDELPGALAALLRTWFAEVSG